MKMDPIVQILEENANNKVKGTASFSNIHSEFCDPDFGQTKAKFGLFSYIPNHIQFEKNRDLINMLAEKNKIDEATKDLLLKMFGKQGTMFPGVGRIRGCFRTLPEASRRADYLVSVVDPYTSVMICEIGVPFPLVEGGHSADIKLIDENNTVDEVITKDMGKKKHQHEKQIRDLKKREQSILSEHTKEVAPLDRYIQNRVKFAQITNTLDDMKNKIEEYSKVQERVISEIKESDTTDPKLKEMYLESYKDACKEIGMTPAAGFLKLMSTEF